MPELIKSLRKINILIIIGYGSIVVAEQLKLDPKYGNGQSEKFIEAIYGLSPNITEEELTKIENSIPPKLTNKYFVRFGFNNGTSSIEKVKNISTLDATQKAIIVSSSQRTTSKKGGELAFGYRWDKFSVELEALATENVRYDKKPLFKDQNGTLIGKLQSVVKAQAVFINTYYDFINLMRFRAFIGFGVGAGINRTNANFSDMPPYSTGINFAKRSVSGAYNFVIGGKINLVSQLFINASFRYTSFSGFTNIKAISTSKVVWRDEANNLHLEGQHGLVGFSISLTHLFL